MVNKQTVIRFIVSPEEKEGIDAEAKRLGLNKSSFIRHLYKHWCSLPKGKRQIIIK